MNGLNAVVLAGGGSRGSYQVGVMNALKKIGYEYSVITGTSVGALNGAFYTYDCGELAETLWKELTTEMILSIESLDDPGNDIEVVKEFLAKAVKDVGIDQMPLKQLLTKYLDVDKFYDSDVDFGLVTVKYPKMQGIQLYKKDIPREMLIDYLMASSACFPAMKSYRINGEAYIDGGYYDTMPLQMAENCGATEIVAVALNAIGVRRKLKNSDINVINIVPKEDLGRLLVFNPEKAKQNIRLGYLDAMKAFKQLEGNDYTFRKNSFKKFDSVFFSFAKFALALSLAGTDNSANVYADTLKRMFEYIIKETSPDIVLNSFALAAAEITAKTFGFPKLNIYSFGTISHYAHTRLDSVKTDDTADLRNIIKRSKNKSEVTAYIYKAVKDKLNGSKEDLHIRYAAEHALDCLVSTIFVIFSEK